MSDLPPIVNSVSEGFINEQKAVIARLDAALAANPADVLSRELLAVARTTLDTAIQGTGWKDPTVLDTRTVAEKLHDRQHGVAPRQASEYEMPQRPAEGFDADALGTAREFLAHAGLDPIVGSANLRDIAEADEDPDPVEVKAHIER